MRTESFRAASPWLAVSVGAFGALAAGMCWAGDEGVKTNGLRILRKEVTVKAPLAEVWRRWTTEDGVTKFAPPKAKIELAIGGTYEWYFAPDAPEGQRGSEGCKVLAFVPMELIAFSWNAPPSIPKLRDSGARTQVVVRFEPRDTDRVHVTLTQAISETGPDWDAYYQYFDKAWGSVLKAMEKSFGADGASELPKSAVGGKARKQWAYYIRPARDDFEKSATSEESKIVQEHAAYIKRLTDEGTVRYAGRSVGEGMAPSEAKAGKFDVPSHGIVVFEADSEKAAKAIMEGDPAVREGVFLAMLKPFHLAFERK